MGLVRDWFTKRAADREAARADARRAIRAALPAIAAGNSKALEKAAGLLSTAGWDEAHLERLVDELPIAERKRANVLREPQVLARIAEIEAQRATARDEHIAATAKLRAEGGRLTEEINSLFAQIGSIEADKVWLTEHLSDEAKAEAATHARLVSTKSRRRTYLVEQLSLTSADVRVTNSSGHETFDRNIGWRRSGLQRAIAEVERKPVRERNKQETEQLAMSQRQLLDLDREEAGYRDELEALEIELKQLHAQTPGMTLAMA